MEDGDWRVEGGDWRVEIGEWIDVIHIRIHHFEKEDVRP